VTHFEPAQFTNSNVIGGLTFERIFVGPSQEVPFRAPLVTYLAATLPGRLYIWRYDMSVAAVPIAFLFALALVGNFSSRP
jgi:hypothetical protein